MSSRQLLRVKPAVSGIKAFAYMPSPSNVAVSLSQHWPISRSRHSLRELFYTRQRQWPFRFLTQHHGIKHNSAANGQERPSTARVQPPPPRSAVPVTQLDGSPPGLRLILVMFLRIIPYGDLKGLFPPLGRSHPSVVSLARCFVFGQTETARRIGRM